MMIMIVVHVRMQNTTLESGLSAVGKSLVFSQFDHQARAPTRALMGLIPFSLHPTSSWNQFSS